MTLIIGATHDADAGTWRGFVEDVDTGWSMRCLTGQVSERDALRDAAAWRNAREDIAAQHRGEVHPDAYDAPSRTDWHRQVEQERLW